MSEDWKAFNEDSRAICKYGVKCYQRNAEHHKNFKHPPQSYVKISKKHNHRFKPYDRIKKPSNEPENKLEKHLNIEEAKVKPSVSSKQDLQSDNETEPEVEKHHNFSFYHKDTDISILKELFSVKMPEDFFKFFDCVKGESKDIESYLASVNLQLIGPYDLLLGKLPKILCKDQYLTHWRFFYDPPEFQSVLKKKGTSQLHIGYFRDDPNNEPEFLAKNDSAKDCIITPVAENIFGAVYWFLQNEKKSSPFVSIACQKLMDKIKKWGEHHNYTIDEYDMKKRLKKVVCRTFHGAGIVVPYDKKTQMGYRPLVEKDGKIKEMFKKLKGASSQEEKDKVLGEIQPIITYASIAVDECDFGTGLEAGIALFCSGLKELQNSALKCLEVAYTLLDRDAFKKIIQNLVVQRFNAQYTCINDYLTKCVVLDDVAVFYVDVEGKRKALFEDCKTVDVGPLMLPTYDA